MSTLYFADSNIWLYRLLENQALDAQEAARKRGIAIALTEANGILISTQVVNEICVNLMRKAAFDEMQIQGFVRSLSQLLHHRDAGNGYLAPRFGIAIGIQVFVLG